jgi:hypothetical protein
MSLKGRRRTVDLLKLIAKALNENGQTPKVIAQTLGVNQSIVERYLPELQLIAKNLCGKQVVRDLKDSGDEWRLGS